MISSEIVTDEELKKLEEDAAKAQEAKDKENNTDQASDTPVNE